MVAAGWSNLTQLQLRDLLRSHGQPTDGSEATLAQRVGAFMNDDHDATAGDDDVGETRRHCWLQQGRARPKRRLWRWRAHARS